MTIKTIDDVVTGQSYQSYAYLDLEEAHFSFFESVDLYAVKDDIQHTSRKKYETHNLFVLEQDKIRFPYNNLSIEHRLKNIIFLKINYNHSIFSFVLSIVWD